MSGTLNTDWLPERRRRGKVEAVRDMTVAEFLQAASEVAQRIPDGTLAKNEVGNLAILSPEGVYAGWVDLRTGEVTITDGR